MSEIKDFGEYLKEKIKGEISSWDDPDIYGVFISIYDNNRGEDPLELPFILEMGYYNSAKWKWDTAAAFCSMDIIETAEERDALIKWLTDMGVNNIGIEDSDTMYDEKMFYIGKGPAGLYETLQFLVDFVKELFEEKFISEKFGRDIPVIFDDLEHTWYLLEATENANPKGLPKEFFSVLERDMTKFLNGTAMADLCGDMSGLFGDMMPDGDSALFRMMKENEDNEAIVSENIMSDESLPFYKKLEKAMDSSGIVHAMDDILNSKNAMQANDKIAPYSDKVMEMMSDHNSPLYQKMQEAMNNAVAALDPSMADIVSGRYAEQLNGLVTEALKQFTDDPDPDKKDK